MRPHIVPYEAPIDADDHEELGRPFRVVARLRNNRLVRAREALGHMSCAAAARAIGVSQGCLNDYESLVDSPWSARDGDWKPSALKIAAAYAYHPEELWPEAVKAVKERAAVLELARPALVVLSEVEAVDLAALKEAVRKQLASLTPRERKVLEARFGIDGGEERKQREIAEEQDVSKERIRQIEGRAMRKLQAAPSMRKLRPFVDPDAPEAVKEQAEIRKPQNKPSFTCPGCGRVVSREIAHYPRLQQSKQGEQGWPGAIWVCNRTAGPASKIVIMPSRAQRLQIAAKASCTEHQVATVYSGLPVSSDVRGRVVWATGKLNLRAPPPSFGIDKADAAR